ncbi:MAG: hypothetical protein P4M02_03540, partial [Clostridia bacterium]|nr:hypothetical protein [Clostridia bacterium]
ALLMAVAILYKDFAILIFVPMILLVEKRLLRVAGYWAIGFSLFLLHNFVFSFDPGYVITQKKLTAVYGFVDHVYANGLPTGFGTAFFIGIGMVLVCIFAYRKHLRNDEELMRYVAYIPLVVYGLFFSFTRWHPQWVVILVPFLVLCVFMNDNFKLSLVTDLLISISYLFVAFMSYECNAGDSMANGGLLPLIFNFRDMGHATLKGLVGMANLPVSLFMTVFVASVLACIVISYPGLQRTPLQQGEGAVFLPERSVIWARALTIFIYIAPTLALYFYHLVKIR